LRDYGFRDLDDIAVMQPQDVGKMLLGESERKARGLRPRTKELRFLLDILGTALSAKVEEALVSDFDRTGEFWDDSHEEQYRIDVRRTTRNFVNMNYQVERKRFSKTGRRYVFCVDASGSMGGAVGKFTRIAVAGAVCAAVAEADPEATFSVAAFNTQGEVLLRRGGRRKRSPSSSPSRRTAGPTTRRGYARRLRSQNLATPFSSSATSRTTRSCLKS